MMERRYMRVPQAAEYLCVSKSLLDKFRCYGGGPDFVKIGRTVLYTKGQLDEWLERQGTVNKSEGETVYSDGDRTALYRHYSSKGDLLYVGISLSAVNRLCAHMADSNWADEISNVTIEWFNCRPAALAAEKTAILTEKPKCNVRHNAAIAKAEGRA